MTFDYSFNKLEVMLIVAGLESLAVYAKRAPEEVQQYIVGLLLEGHIEIPYEELTKHIDSLQTKLSAGVPNEKTDGGKEVSILPETPTMEQNETTSTTPSESNRDPPNMS